MGEKKEKWETFKYESDAVSDCDVGKTARSCRKAISQFYYFFHVRSNKISYPECSSLFRKDRPEPELQLSSHSRMLLHFIVCLNSYIHTFRIEETVERKTEISQTRATCSIRLWRRENWTFVSRSYYISMFCPSKFHTQNIPVCSGKTVWNRKSSRPAISGCPSISPCVWMVICMRIQYWWYLLHATAWLQFRKSHLI
jgi:hypothetical protein